MNFSTEHVQCMYSNCIRISSSHIMIFSLMTVSCVDWVDICTDDSGNKCCGGNNDGMGDEASRHLYWIMRNTGK